MCHFHPNFTLFSLCLYLFYLCHFLYNFLSSEIQNILRRKTLSYLCISVPLTTFWLYQVFSQCLASIVFAILWRYCSLSHLSAFVHVAVPSAWDTSSQVLPPSRPKSLTQAWSLPQLSGPCSKLSRIIITLPCTNNQERSGSLLCTSIGISISSIMAGVAWFCNDLFIGWSYSVVL